MFTTAFRDQCLELLDGHFVGWISAVTDWRAGTVTELSYAGYARAAVTMGAPENTAVTGGRRVRNSAIATGGQKTDAGSALAILWGLWTASTAGTLKAIGGLDADPPIVGAVDDTTGDQIIVKSHGLVVDQRVIVLAAPGAEIPAGLTENTRYFVGTVVDANRITLSTTAGNANPVAITSQGAAIFVPHTELSIAQNATPEFAVNALAVEL